MITTASSLVSGSHSCPAPAHSPPSSQKGLLKICLIIFLALFHPFHLPCLCMAGSGSSFSSWFKCCLIRGPPLIAPTTSSRPPQLFFACALSWFPSQHLSQCVIVCLLFTCLAVCLPSPDGEVPGSKASFFCLLVLSQGPSSKSGAQSGCSI